jgi:hypothetical protein
MLLLGQKSNNNNKSNEAINQQHRTAAPVLPHNCAAQQASW